MAGSRYLRIVGLLGLVLLGGAGPAAGIDCAERDPITWKIGRTLAPTRVLFDAPEVVVPFKELLGHPYVNVAVDGEELGLFLIDTCASQTTIYTERARELPEEMWLEKVPWEGEERSMLKVSTLEVGGVTFEVPGVWIDDQELSEQSGEPVVGVLGFDLLSALPFSLVYSAFAVRFYDREAFAPPEGEPIRICSAEFPPVLELEFVEGKPQHFGIDTGGHGGLILRQQYPVDLRERYGPPIMLGKLELAMLKRSVPWTAHLGDIDVFGTTLRKMPIAALLPDMEMRAVGAEGLLGSMALRRFDLTFDFAGSRMWAEPNGVERFGNTNVDDPLQRLRETTWGFAPEAAIAEMAKLDSVSGEVAAGIAGFNVPELVVDAFAKAEELTPEEMEKALRRIAFHGNVAVFRKAVEGRSTEGVDGMEILNMSLVSGGLEMVKEVAAHFGIDLWALPEEAQARIFHRAAIGGNKELLKWLGGELDLRELPLTPDDLGHPVAIAAWANNVEALRTLLEELEVPLTERDYFNAVGTALMHDHFEAVVYLLKEAPETPPLKGKVDAGAVPDAAVVDGEVRTLLSTAGGFSRKATLELLVELGADPLQTDEDGMTALTAALIRRNSMEVVEYLVEQGLRPTRNDIVWTADTGRAAAFASAVEHFDEELTPELYGELVKVAAKEKRPKILRNLFDHAEERIGEAVPQKSKNEALRLAIGVGSLRVAALLLDEGADPLGIVDGTSPIVVMSHFCDMSMLNLLLESVRERRAADGSASASEATSQLWEAAAKAGCPEARERVMDFMAEL